MELKLRTLGDVTVFAFHGPVTRGHGTLLRRTFDEALDGGKRRFVFNFSESAYLDSASIGETLSCLKRAQERGGELKLVVTDGGKIRKLFEITSLHKVFEIFHDEKDAARAFSD